jgi:teichuronic acid biosynthesis glycosyltransferase TuaC
MSTASIRVAVVAREKQGHLSPFVEEQIEALRKKGIYVRVVPLTNSSLGSYLSLGRRISEVVRRDQIDIVHAHYGLTGLAATLRMVVPTVVTFHGSDINQPRARPFSRLAAKRAAASIYVSRGLALNAPKHTRSYVIPCGVNPIFFDRVTQEHARQELGLPKGPIVLFASSADIPVKNYPLAAKAVSRIARPVTLLELKNRTRAEVRLLLCAADVLLMTSLSEGSPQVVKEAVAAGCPIISTDVGDVREQIGRIEGCHITAPDDGEIAERIEEVLRSDIRIANGAMDHLHSDRVASRIADVYIELIRGR